MSSFLLLLSITTFFRWGPLGHRVVAQIAQDRLSPAVAAETRRLLGGQNIADIASWADEQRSTLGPTYSPWHYVDIEIYDTSYVPSRDCKEGACVIAALQKQAAILADKSQSDSARGFALRWVVHLVGDIHQPLHAGERNDKGGNDVKLSFDGRQTNLHSLWDGGLLNSYGESADALAHRLEQRIAQRNDVAAIANSSVVQWAMESHDISRDYVYKGLPSSLEVTQAYAEGARPIIDDRLSRGGIRLAAVIEKALAH